MTTTDVRTGATTAPAVLQWSRGQVDPALRAAVDTLPDDVRHIAGYHFGWWDEHGTPTESAGGKALRSALVLVTAEAVGGSARQAVPAAVAVELVHNFSLLHDDVMDNDTTRRHRRTAWDIFGVGPAILAGDALLNLASDVLAASDHPGALSAVRTLNGVVQELIRGQVSDIAFEQRDDVTPQECRSMARAKTGALLGCACALGAEFGHASTERVESLRAFGEHLGLAFQHVDDLLGIWGDPEVTGKPTYSDLRSGKKTLPVVAALNTDTAAGHELAARYDPARGGADAEPGRAAELIEQAGGRAWCSARADEELDLAHEHLRAADPVARADELRALVGFVTGRQR